MTAMKEALYWEKKSGKVVQCVLCPHECVIPDRKRGRCGVRENSGGTLFSLVYARPCSINIDPIEKKPLYHFLPGTTSLSIGTAGCNLRCMHCQNWEISRAKPETLACPTVEPAEIVERALSAGCASISYTYNEPSVYYEFVIDTAKRAHARGIRNVMVTNGYINREPLRELYAHIDAANVDLKGFSESFYQKVCGAKLQPVLETLKELHAMKVWFEITNLLIPGYNDSLQEIRALCSWIKDNLGTDHPLHFTAFHPDYKLLDTPATPLTTLQAAYGIAHDIGLRFVYKGNVQAEQSSTICPECGAVLVKRSGFRTLENRITNGRCVNGHTIPGVWE